MSLINKRLHVPRPTPPHKILSLSLPLYAAPRSYIPVRLLEICLPPPKIHIRNQGPSKNLMQQDLKDFFLK